MAGAAIGYKLRLCQQILLHGSTFEKCVMSSINNKLPDLTSPTLMPKTQANPIQPEDKVEIRVNLRNIPLLAQLTVDEMESVKMGLRIRSHARRNVVLQKGAHGESLMFLLSGEMQVIDVTEDGRVISVRTLSQGDFFGEIALINSTANFASVVALSDVLVAFLPSATALNLFLNSPSVASHLLRHLAQQVQRDAEFRALLSINNKPKRIFSFLVHIRKKTTENQYVIENLPTHQDIANMINTSRETVTRTLLILVQQGIIQKDAHRLIIVNPDALQKLTRNP